MGMGTHVGIQTEGHTSHLALGCSQLINHLQFRDALHIEAENIVIQAEVDLPVALAYTSVDNLRTRETCLDTGFYFATTNAIDT